jgi:hypothetical protein
MMRGHVRLSPIGDGVGASNAVFPYADVANQIRVPASCTPSLGCPALAALAAPHAKLTRLALGNSQISDFSAWYEAVGR